MGAKSRFVSTPVPAAVRSYACPWLGPNLRLASDVQLLWCSTKLKKPVHCFIPLTLPCTMHLTTSEATNKTDEKINKMIETAVENAAKAASANADKPDVPHASAASDKKKKKDKKRGGRHEYKVEYANVGIPLLDTRSIFVLQAKVGDEFWTLKKDVELNQPTIHYKEWPTRLRKEAFAAGQFSERTRPAPPVAIDKGDGGGSDNAGDSSTVAPTNGHSSSSSHHEEKEGKRKGGKEGKKKGGKGGGTGPPETRLVDIKAAMRAAKDAVSPLDVAKKASAYRGGISFYADEFSDFIAIVVGTPSETVTFDVEGGLLRSPILHPLMSVRVPKLALKDTKTSTFKAVQIRPELIHAIHHFDSQLTEISECSNIYELDLGISPFDRPITVTMPLPQWYTDLVQKMRELPDKSHAEPVEGEEGSPVEGAANEDGIAEAIGSVNGGERDSGPVNNKSMPGGAGVSTRHGSRSPKSSKKKSQDNANNETQLSQRPEKHLVLVYQRPNQKRQLVWRPCSGDPNSDNIVNRKKQQKSGSYRDITVSPILRGENMNAKNGWLHLLLGLKGAPWKDVPIKGPFTPRCLQINTFQLGRFALIHSNDPIRTPASKLSHMMSRMEALSVAPPGVLLPCVQATATKVTLWINCVPSSRIIDVLEERLQAGFLPLIQSNASPSRRCAAVANCTFQTLPHLIPPIENNNDQPSLPNYGQSNYRFSGYDLLRVLLYNGLCIRVVIRGHMQIKTQGAFDCFTNIFDHRRKNTSTILNGVSSTDGGADGTSTTTAPALDDSALNLGGGARGKSPAVTAATAIDIPIIPRPDQYITRMETRFAYNDLIPETATIVELEPIREYFAQKVQQRIRKDRLIRDLMNRRLEEIEKRGPYSPDSGDFSKSPDRQGNNAQDASVASNTNRANSVDVTANEDSSNTEHGNSSIWTATSTSAPGAGTEEMTTADVTNTEKTSVSTHRHAEVAEDTDDVGNDNDQTEPSSELLEEGGNNASAVAASSPEELEDVDEDEGGDEEEGAAGGDDLPAGLDGDDDKTSKQHFTELLKAFSAKNSPLLGFEVGKDICRRLTNLYDRGLVHEAREFVQSVYEVYVAARVEFHLVQPSELSQVREKPKDTMANVSNKEALDGTAEEGDDKSAILGVDTEAESDVEVEKIECASDVLDFHAAAENQSNMKWNRNMGIADPKDGDPQPLATFDVLVDPELFARWAPKGKKMPKFS